jgi:hypothetical protein
LRVRILPKPAPPGYSSRGLRLLCVAALLAAAACGPFGGPAGIPPGAVAATASARSTAPPPAATGPAGVLLQLASPSTYSLSLVFTDGHVVGPVTARLRTVQPSIHAAPAALPVFSASDSRVYYLDGDTDVRSLGLDGGRSAVTHVPGGGRTQSAFAVSPDDRRLAVTTLDGGAEPATMRLAVEDVAGGSHLELMTSATDYLWPVGWHGGGVVVAVGSAPTQTVAGNPYGTFSGYQVLDAATGNRLSAIECNPAGALTPAGTACLSGGAPLTLEDFLGRPRTLTAAPVGAGAIVSAAQAPDGLHAAFCCLGGQLQLWDVGSGVVSDLGVAGPEAYGWIDPAHLLIGDSSGQRTRVVDVATGTETPVQAAGRVVGRVPGGL